MREGVCPKCQGREIYRVSQGGVAGHIALGVLQSVPLIHLICTDCGYVELYIPAKSQLPKVRKYGRRIGDEGRDGE